MRGDGPRDASRSQGKRGKEFFDEPNDPATNLYAMKSSRLLSFAVLGSLLVGSVMRAEDTKAAAPASPSPAAAPEKVGAPELENGYLKLGFEQLASYAFNPPPFDPSADPKATPPSGEEQIPASVKAWNGKKAVVTFENGYMTGLYELDGEKMAEVKS